MGSTRRRLCDQGEAGDESGAPCDDPCRGYARICGLDEVGRGPLAGPVVAAAVILPRNSLHALQGLGDSKQLSRKARESLVPRIYEVALSVGVAVIEPAEIDEINILQASLRAMAGAVAALTLAPDRVLVDGNQRVPLSISQKTMVGGDARCACIAAASNVAKEHRDALMREYGVRYPGYGFEIHMGYPTRFHRLALERLGPSPIHRRSFRGVREGSNGRIQTDLFSLG